MFIVGVGGFGSLVVFYFVVVGVGIFGIVDFDCVEEYNF